MRILTRCSLLALGLAFATAPVAQTTDPMPATDAAQPPAADQGALLTQAQLETMVAPVALYPDTLLMQLLIAATVPLDVVKAAQFLDGNSAADPETLKPEIDAKDWDQSVKVLATAFPDVIGDMADHIDWTEAMGDAMLAQTDDVMTAIQTLRQQAINNGALQSGEQQTVEVTKDSTTNTETVVIEPTDPQVVYVPQYDSNTIFGNPVGDALLAGAIAWGTFTLIDEIFDDDDDWNGYWGCRNCGGWNGAPIIRNPDVDIDIDGDVNIGNRFEVDRDKIDIDRDKVTWKPDQASRDKARDRIENSRGPGGATTLPIKKPASRADDLRGNLAQRPETRDLAGKRPDVNRPEVDRPSKFSPASKDAAIAKTKGGGGNFAGAGGGSKPSVKKPSAPQKPVAKPNNVKKPTAIQKQAPAKVTRAGSKRGSASKGKMKRR